VAAKELERAFVGVELEEEFAKFAAQRIRATERGSLLREFSEKYWRNA
jgi:DNA modification methylase